MFPKEKKNLLKTNYKNIKNFI